ncbi:MAG: DUF58 domain-containing protein [Fibrobacter sp.]|jgi:uncharacterized protein (DUF58 family)|nr:DUF58 domain-containing protein [Fibrobacter sp.]
MKTAALVNPKYLIPLNLNLRAKMIVEGTIAGLHKSPYHGFSAEFLEYRPYLEGESTRRIDWRKFAKTDRTVVKLFEDETNLFAHILVDKSASMAFSSSGNMTKFEYARTLAASLAMLLVNQRDAVGLAVFDEQIGTFLPPRSTNIQLRNIINSLNSIQPGAATLCGKAVDTLARSINKRGLCVIISDLFDELQEVIRGLRHLRFKRQDIIVIWVLDPFELDFSSGASYRIDDLETGQSLTLDGYTASKYFSEGLEKHRREIELACKEMQIDFESVSTEEPFGRSLMRVLEKRRHLH